MKKVSLLVLIVTCAALALASAGDAQTALTDESVRLLLETALRQYLDPGSDLAVMVSGVAQTPDGVTIADVTIDAQPAIIRGVRTELFAQMSNVTLDAAVTAGTAGVGAAARVKSAGRVMLVARTTAEELQKAMAARFPILQDPKITFNAGQFVVTGMLRDLKQPASLRGRFIVERGQQVRVQVLEALVNGAPVPVQLVEGELAKMNPVLDLSKSPIPLRIRLIAVHENRIEVLAGTD